MSWHYSQALVEEFLAGSCLDGDACAQLKSNRIAEKSSFGAKKKAISKPSPSGMMSALSTATLGVAKWMSSLGDSHVRTSAPLAEAKESTEADRGFGGKWPASLAKYDPDSRSWKTRQHSLLGGLIEFSATWPRWGMTVGGALFLLPIPEPPTSESASGLWPTPKATQGGPDYGKRQRGAGGDDLTTAVARQIFPTPNASDNRDRGNRSTPAVKRRIEKGKQISLSMSVSEESGQLNPTWVEWLMGWPEEWTDLAPLATDRFREWQQQHGDF